MKSQSPGVVYRLLSAVVLLTLLISQFAFVQPAVTRAAQVQPERVDEAGAQVFRTAVRFAGSRTLARLEETDVVVLSADEEGATVLATATQLETVARLRFGMGASDSLEGLLARAPETSGWLVESLAPVVEQAQALARWEATSTAELSTADDSPPPLEAKLQATLQALRPEQMAALNALSSIDDDADGLTNTQESWWCTDPLNPNSDGDAQGYTDGQEVAALLDVTLSRTERWGYGAPFGPPNAWPNFNNRDGTGVKVCNDGDFDTIPDFAEVYMVGSRVPYESTDNDKFDDGQELFGVTYCPGAPTNCGYGSYPAVEYWNFIKATMPSWALPPGDSPFVAAFPVPEVYVEPGSWTVERVTTITTSEGQMTQTTHSYETSATRGEGSSIADTVTWNEWEEVSEAVETPVSAYSYASGYSPLSPDGSKFWGGVKIVGGVLAIGAGCGLGIVTTVGYVATCAAGAVAGLTSIRDGIEEWRPDELQNEIQVNNYNSNININDVSSSASAQASAQVVNKIDFQGVVQSLDGVQYAISQQGELLARGLHDISYQLSRPRYTETRTNGRSWGGSQTTTHEVYEEHTISEGEAFSNGQNWETAWAVDSSHAADLTFTYHVRNSGTEYARELSGLVFNIYLGDDTEPTLSYPAWQQFAGGKLDNLFPVGPNTPGGVSSQRTFASTAVPLSLEQMKRIDLGERLTIKVESYSYGADELFYTDAVSGGVTVYIEDGVEDGDETVDTYVIPTWGVETVADVLARYFPHGEDADGNLNALWTPEFDGINPPVWHEHYLSDIAWWNVYLTQPDAGSTPLHQLPAQSGSGILFRFNRDSDRDGYNDRAEFRYYCALPATHPDAAYCADGYLRPEIHPQPELLAGYVTQRAGNAVTTTLALENTGTFDAYGIDAVMISPDDTTTIGNNTVGGNGRVRPGQHVAVGSLILEPDLGAWGSSTSRPYATGSYSGTADRTYTFSVQTPGVVGQSGTTVAWSDGVGGSGTLNLGTAYHAPLPLDVAQGLQVGFNSGSLSAGASFSVQALTPRDTFQYTINSEPYTPPLIIVSGSDPQGSKRFITPVELPDLGASLAPYSGAMLPNVGLDIVATAPFESTGANTTSFVVNNPQPVTIEGGHLYLNVVSDGTLVLEKAYTMDYPAGPTIRTETWSASEFAAAYNPDGDNILIAFWTDSEDNIIDSAARPFMSFQQDATAAAQSSVDTWDFGTVTQGEIVRTQLSVASIGSTNLLTGVELDGTGLSISTGDESNAALRKLDNLIFSDEFQGDLSDWGDEIGTWWIADEQLCSQGAGGAIDAWIYAGNTTWTDYALETTVSFIENNAELVVRSTGHWHNEYRITFWGNEPGHPYANTYGVSKFQGGDDSVLQPVNAPTPINITNPAKLRVEVIGNELSIFINDQFVNRYVDENPLTHGRIGLGAIWDYRNCFDYVRVTAPNLSVQTFDVNPASFAELKVTLDTAEAPTGPYNGTVTVRTNDKDNPFLTLGVIGTIDPSAGSAFAFAVDQYRPWEQLVHVQGNHNLNDTLTFDHTITDLPSEMHPLYVYSQDESTLLGVGEFGPDFTGQTVSSDIFGDGRDGVMPASGNLDSTNGFGVGTLNGSAGTASISVVDRHAVSRINPGDMVLIHQTQGTGAGNWEMNKAVSNFTGSGTFALETPLEHTYITDSGNNKAQILRVPQYATCLVTDTVTPLSAWNGMWGGIFAVMCNDTMDIQGTINVSGAGFTGGAGSRRSWGHTGFQGESYPGPGISCNTLGCTSMRTNNGGGGGSNGSFAIGSGAGNGGGYGTNGEEGWPGHGSGGVVHGDAGLNTFFLGSGGGGAYEDGDKPSPGGNGGNGGGAIILFVRSLNLAGSLQSQGSNGQDSSSRAGGAGSGGAIKIVSEVANVGSNQVTALGGNGGVDPGGNLGGDGGVGRIRIEYCKTLSGTTNPAASTEQITCYIARQLPGSPNTELILPEAVAGYGRFHVQYGQRGNFSAAGTHDYSVTLPKRVYETVTLDALFENLGAANFNFSLDIGADGSNEWNSNGTEQPLLLNSPDLATGLNAYLASTPENWGEDVAIPIRLTLNTSGDVFLTNIVATPGADSDPALDTGDLTVNNSAPVETDRVPLTASVRNVGDYMARNVVVSFFAGDPAVDGVYIGSDFIPAIGAGSNVQATVTWDTTGYSGPIMLHATVDISDQIAEQDEDNNSASLPVTVYTRPDLQVTAINLDGAPRSGITVNIVITLMNGGNTDAGTQQVKLYEGNPDSGGSLIGSATIAVAGATSVNLSIPWTPVSPGPRTLHVRADDGDAISEFDEGNNTGWSDVYVGLAGPVLVDSGSVSADPIYTAALGYGAIDDGPMDSFVSCGGSSSSANTMRLDAGGKVTYQFDHLLPGRFYHLDVTLFECDGAGRQESIFVDGYQIDGPYNLGDGQVRQLSLLLDPALYADNRIQVSIAAPGIDGAVVSAVHLYDIDYRYADAGGGQDPQYPGQQGYGWLDGSASTTWGTLPYQSARVDVLNNDLRYRFDNLDPARKYDLALTFWQPSGTKRVQTVQVDGVAANLTVDTGDYQVHRERLIVPVGAYTDGSIVVRIVRSNASTGAMVNEIALEEKTVLSLPGISEVQVSNLSDTAATISWLTDAVASGQVAYGTTTALGQVGQDVRGAQTQSQTHLVTLTGLTPATTYYFAVTSDDATDDNGGSRYSFTTGPTLTPPPSDTVFGQVFDENGAAAAGALVTISLRDGDNQGSTGASGALASLVSGDGYWNVNLGSARTSDGQARFSYSATGDELVLRAVDGSGCSASAVVDTANDTPAPALTLSCDTVALHALVPGWNLLAPNVAGEPPTTASAALAEVNAQGGAAAEIDRWQNGGWEGHVLGFPFNNFELELGRGYFLKATGSSTWERRGAAPGGPVALSLNPGWNLAGFPQLPAPLTAAQLLAGISAQGGSCGEVDRWVNGGWEGHVQGFPFNNFDLNEEEGYFVKCAGTSSYTPSAGDTQASLPAWRAPLKATVQTAAEAAAVSEVLVTNRRDVAFTVTWQTDAPVQGWVQFGVRGEPLERMAYDVRGAETVAQLHQVTVAGLAPEETYTFEVHAGGEVAGPYEVTTRASGPPPVPLTAFGQVEDAGGNPAVGALAIGRLVDMAGNESEPLSVLVDGYGYWVLSLDVEACGDYTLVLDVVGEGAGYAELRHAACDLQPAPTLQLDTVQPRWLFLPAVLKQ